MKSWVCPVSGTLPFSLVRFRRWRVPWMRDMRCHVDSAFEEKVEKEAGEGPGWRGWGRAFNDASRGPGSRGPEKVYRVLYSEPHSTKEHPAGRELWAPEGRKLSDWTCSCWGPGVSQCRFPNLIPEFSRPHLEPAPTISIRLSFKFLSVFWLPLPPTLRID